MTEILLLNVFVELRGRKIFRVNLILHWFCCIFSGPDTLSDNVGFPLNSPSKLDVVYIVCKVVCGCQCERRPKQLSQYGNWLYDGRLELDFLQVQKYFHLLPSKPALESIHHYVLGLEMTGACR